MLSLILRIPVGDLVYQHTLAEHLARFLQTIPSHIVFPHRQIPDASVPHSRPGRPGSPSRIVEMNRRVWLPASPVVRIWMTRIYLLFGLFVSRRLLTDWNFATGLCEMFHPFPPPLNTQAPHLHPSVEKVHLPCRQKLCRHSRSRVKHATDTGSSPIFGGSNRCREARRI